MPTTITKATTIVRCWHLFDLKGQILGRSATRIASLLIGKNKPYFTPNLDCGDYVVVTNAAQVKVTGQKTTDKLYRHHTGYPKGFRQFTYQQVSAKDPKEIIFHAVKGMLPKNKLRDSRLRRLKVFVTDRHPYQDQLQLNKKASQEHHGQH